MGSSAGHWTSVHIVHNNGELLTVIFIRIYLTLECPLSVILWNSNFCVFGILTGLVKGVMSLLLSSGVTSSLYILFE